MQVEESFKTIETDQLTKFILDKVMLEMSMPTSLRA